MDKKTATPDQIYLLTMTMAKKMFDARLIGVEVYKNFEVDMQRKYAPNFCELFSNIDLL